jgi:integrase
MGIWKDSTRKDWRYSFQYRGEIYAGGGHETRREAAAAREDRRKKIKSQKTQTGTAFSDIANQYLDEAERRFAAQTYRYKRHVYGCFIKHAGNIPVESITEDHVSSYLSTLTSNNLFNVHRKDLSALFTWAQKVKRIAIHNPCAAIDKMPHNAADKIIPSEKEVLAIIAASAPGDDRDIILTCIHTLGRIDEVLRLRWQDVNFDLRSVTLWTRKRKGGEFEADTLPLNEALYSVLYARWKARKQDLWIFYNEKRETRYMHRPKMMRGICKRARVPFYGFHALRHFMATMLSDKAKVSTPVVSALLRHKNIRTTEIYLHSANSALREAMDQADVFFTSKKDDPQASPASKESKNGVSMVGAE